MKLLVFIIASSSLWLIGETGTLKMDGAFHSLASNVSYFFLDDKYLTCAYHSGKSTFTEEGVLKRLFPSVPNSIEAAHKIKGKRKSAAFIKNKMRYRVKHFEFHNRRGYPDDKDEVSLSIPERPDAIALDTDTNKTFIFKNDSCWIIDVSGSRAKLLTGFPKHCSKCLHGAPSNMEAALVIDQNLYALKDGSVWKWNVISTPSNLTVGYPKRFNEVFAGTDTGPAIFTHAPFSSKQFVGFVIRELETASLLDCIKECQKMPYFSCSSFNFEAFGKKDRCQISRFKKTHFPENLIENDKFVYYEVYW